MKLGTNLHTGWVYLNKEHFHHFGIFGFFLYLAQWGGERKESPRSTSTAQSCSVCVKDQSCSKAGEGKLRFSESISIGRDNYRCHVPNFFF